MVTVGSIVGGTFRFVGSNVRSVLVWSAAIFVLSLAMMAMTRPLYEAQKAALQQGAGAGTPPFGLFFLGMLVMLVGLVIIGAATFRAVLFPQDSRFAYLRLGMDEVRLLGCSLILLIGFYLVVAVGAMAVGLLAAIVGAATDNSSYAVVAAAGGVAALLLTLWLMPRLSLVLPMTLLDRKIVIGPAWRLTRGHYWRLLGAYIVIALVLMVVYGVLFSIRFGSGAGDMLHPTDPAAALRNANAQIAATSLSVRNLAISAISALIGGFGYALSWGGMAVATAQLRGLGDGQPLQEIFS